MIIEKLEQMEGLDNFPEIWSIRRSPQTGKIEVNGPKQVRKMGVDRIRFTNGTAYNLDREHARKIHNRAIGKWLYYVTEEEDIETAKALLKF